MISAVEGGRHRSVMLEDKKNKANRRESCGVEGQLGVGSWRLREVAGWLQRKALSLRSPPQDVSKKKTLKCLYLHYPPYPAVSESWSSSTPWCKHKHSLLLAQP